MEDTNFYGVDIVTAYDMSIQEKYNIIKENTKYLDNIDKKEIKDIKINYYKDIIILLNNGNVYLNGEELYKNIRFLIFMSGINIFGISNSNEIITITGCDNNTRFMTNNNYKYKKLIINPLVIVALTYENEIKMYGSILDFAINYKLFFDVEDIAYVEEEDEIVVLKNNKIISLLTNTEYYDVNITLTGEGNNYLII